MPAGLRTSSIFFLVATPERSHPFPSRTRKLSSPGPMVLQAQVCGRVGRCRGFEGPLARAGLHLFRRLRVDPDRGHSARCCSMKKLLVVCAALAIAAGCKKKQREQPAPPTPDPKLTEPKKPEPPPPPPGPDPKVVERGAYLVKAGACLVCHTAMGAQGPDMANVGGGGLEMKEKFGTWRSPNITPDKTTGIGSWTDDQIAAAIREGVRPDGKQLTPIMPYMNFNVMTDD